MESHSDAWATKSTLMLPTAVEAAAPGSQTTSPGSQTAAHDAQTTAADAQTAAPGTGAAPGPHTAAPDSQAATPGTDTIPGTDAIPGTDTGGSAIGPLTQPALNTDDAPRDVRVQVEAFGSGAILHGGIDVPSNKSVGDLRELVVSSIKLPPRTRTVRLFVGHGGTELDNDDETLLSESLAAVDWDTTPLVVFPVQCTSVLCPWCHNNTAGGDAWTHFQRLLFVLRGG